MKSTKVLSAVALMSFASTMAMAASDAPTLGSLFENTGITVGGAVAGSLRQNLSVPNPGQARSSFQLDQALLSVAYLPKEGFGAALDVASGGYNDQYGQVGNPKAGTALSQAYLQYKSGALTVQAGRFYTLAGYEVFPVASNLFVSRSVAFAGSTVAGAEIKGESTYHTGVRASYATSDTLTFNFGVNDGIYDNLDAQQTVLKEKAVEVGVNWKASSDLSLAVTSYTGKTGAGGVKQSLLSVVANYSYAKDLNFALSVDQGNYNNTEAGKWKWTAVALYGVYDLNDKTKLGLRIEEINPKLSTKNGIGSLTGVVSYNLAKNLDVRGEVSNVDVEGAYPRTMQAAVQGVLKF